MQIEKLVGNFESIFDPKVTFCGAFLLNSDIFSGASKKENGLNLVEEKLYKKYLTNIYPDYDSFMQSVRIPIFFSSTSKDGYGRELIPVPSLFLKALIFSIFKYEFDKIEEFDEKVIHEKNKKFLKEMKESINDILNGKMKLEDNKILYNTYMKSKKGMGKTLKDQEVQSRNINEKLEIRAILTNEEKLKKHFLKKLKTYTTRILLYYDSMVKDLTKPLDLSTFNNLINYDDFYLRLANIFMKEIEFILKDYGELPSTVMFLYKYYNVLKELKTYRYKTDISDILLVGEKKRVYSTQDFIRDFERIILPIEDPDIRYYQIMEKDDSTDYRDLNNVKKKKEYLKALDDARALAAEWDFVPKGQLLEPREKTSTNNVRTSKKVDFEAREKRLEKVLKRQQFLDNSPYIYKAHGKNKFEGYVAYIYANGFVIFEKFYENQETKLPSRTNATYVMTIDNFVEMSKLSKPELMDYIKAGNTDVMRKPHTAFWEANILGIINSAFYSKEIVEKIDMLITLGKIEQSQELRKSYE